LNLATSGVLFLDELTLSLRHLRETARAAGGKQILS
jgi:hypothetical protein